jgi:hypothetical protein
MASTTSASAWFTDGSSSTVTTTDLLLEKTKAQVLQLGAALDRGQSYNPTSGAYYEETMKTAKAKIEALVGLANPSKLPQTLEDMQGEWELVLSTVRNSHMLIGTARYMVLTLLPLLVPILGTARHFSKFSFFPCDPRKL